MRAMEIEAKVQYVSGIISRQRRDFDNPWIRLL
jgi:hypothetical protein